MPEGPYPVYGASGIVGYLPSYQNGAPYVAVVKDGAGVGRVCRCKGESSVLGTMQALIPFNDVNCSFLFHLVRSLRLGSGFSGSTIPHIYFKDYGKRIVRLPDLNDQRTIAAILDGVESIAATREGYLAKLDDLRKSRFIEMFGDPDANPKRFETKLGSALFKIGNGKARSQNLRYEAGIPAYGGNGVSWYTDEVLVDHPTIIIGRVGRHCGNTRLVEEACWVTDNAMYIRKFLGNCYDVVFLDALMRIIGFNRFADRGDLWKITQKPFMEYSFPVPPLALQREFAAFVRQVDKLEFRCTGTPDEGDNAVR